MNVATAFAGDLLSLQRKGFSPEARHETRRTLLNVLGTVLGAARAPDVDRVVAAGMSLGGGEIAPLGRPELLDRFFAATVIGFAGHLDDFDDTHLATVIHPGAATLGAWYVQGNLDPVDPETALSAFALGVESQLRVGIAMSPSHYDDGWHITGTCGVIGAAVAAAVLMGLDVDGLASAISLAAEMTIGHREGFGTPTKAFHAGKAASNGLLAALLARNGLRVSSDLFGVTPGFFGALAHEHDLGALAPEDGRLALLDNSYKPFPCGIVAHPAIEAAIGLSPAVRASGSAIVEVLVDCNPLVPELMGRPDATNGLEARFCARHGVAVGLVRGRAGLVEFSDEEAIDPEIRGVREVAVLRPDPACARDAASVTVRFADGRVESNTIEVAAGSTSRPLTDAELLGKFRALAEETIGPRTKELMDCALGLGETGPVDIACIVAEAALAGRAVQ